MKKSTEQTYTIQGVDGSEQEVKLLFTQFSPKQGLKVAIRFSKVIGGPLGKVFSGVKKGEATKLEDFEFDFEHIGKAVESLFDRLDEDEVLDTLDLLLSCVLKGNVKLNTDDIMFQGKPLLALKVAMKSAEVNFSDFFGETSGVLGKIKETLSLVSQE